MTDASDPRLEEWPPPGFSSSYAVDLDAGDGDVYRFDVVLPGTFSKVDISTFRMGRHGGPTAEDESFRSALFQRVGAITVAAGHVESALKRLLLVLEAPEKAEFSSVDEVWSTLHKKLRQQCDGSDSRRIALAAVLDSGDDLRLKERRDSAIHSDWLIFASGRARRSRFAHDSNGAMIFATLDDLVEDARLLFEYAGKLDALLGNDWPIGRLPGPYGRRPAETS